MSNETLLVLLAACGASFVIAAVALFWQRSLHDRRLKAAWDRWHERGVL